MGPKPFPLRALGVSLRLVLLLGVGPASGAAQATGGFTTAFTLATEAAVGAVTTRVYPVALYAGRDEDGIPHYIQRPFSDEERRLLREHFGIEDPGSLYLSDTTAGAYLNYDTERDPGAGRLVRSYRVGAPSVRLPGETWEQLERRLATLSPSDFPESASAADTALASLDPEARPEFERMLAAARRAGHRVKVVETPHGGAPGLSPGLRRRPHLHRHLQAQLRPRGGCDRGRRKPEAPAHSRPLDRLPSLGERLRGRALPSHRTAREVLGLAPHRAARPHGVSVDRSAPSRGADR